MTIADEREALVLSKLFLERVAPLLFGGTLLLGALSGCGGSDASNFDPSITVDSHTLAYGCPDEVFKSFSRSIGLPVVSTLTFGFFDRADYPGEGFPPQGAKITLDDGVQVRAGSDGAVDIVPLFGDVRTYDPRKGEKLELPMTGGRSVTVGPLDDFSAGFGSSGEDEEQLGITLDCGASGTPSAG